MEREMRVQLGLGHAATALADASTHLTLAYDQVPAAEREVLKDIRWHAAESARLLRHLRRSHLDRLAGATRLEGSPHTSMHDPPETDAAPERKPDPTT